MKKLLVIGLLTGMVLGMASCGSPADTVNPGQNAGKIMAAIEGEDSVDHSVFRAEVLEIKENYIIVEPLEGEWERNSADQIVAGFDDLEEVPSLSVGDTVQIEYEGGIAESYPAQIGNVYAIQKVEEALNQTDNGTEQESDNGTAQSSEPPTAAYSYEDIAMSINLSSEWDYEIQTVETSEQEERMASCGIDFWLKEDPDVKLELGYWPDGIGMCGTGVTIEEIDFANGLSAWKYTETIEKEVWLTIIYKQNPQNGAYVIQGHFSEEAWTEHEKEVMERLDTVQLSVS